jgi:sulfite reductase (NADPH) hemoprotein beta-component
VGGGLGRTPFVGKTLRDFLPVDHMLSYLTALVRVYNLQGRRDNKYKARIKITVHEQGLETFKSQVEEEFARMTPADMEVPERELARIAAYFAPPVFDTSADPHPLLPLEPGFDRWRTQNVAQHRVPGYGIVNISLKPTGGIPGDISSQQMRTVADLAEAFGLNDIRATHEQNLVLPHVRLSDLPKVYDGLRAAGLATANIGQIGDMIACPGMDYCALATARSIPVAQAISTHFEDRADQLGELKIKISGCINACGHHHVGHIGILGVDKKGEELYQLTLGGSGDETASIGKIIGPGFSGEEVPGAIETLLNTYEETKIEEERFIDTYRRVGDRPFKDALYGSA